ncbi:enoyl-CoA hydratase/isomerase family protein [Mycobacterium xenopi 3993]|nr:enoyl-CoA hydratase/isomerase family protein [Mycobacterium xenopi 3993]
MLRVVDLSAAPDVNVAPPPGVIVAFGSATDLAAPYAETWLTTATFTITEDTGTDRRVITVDSVPKTLAELRERCAHWPQASAVCDDVLRSIDPRRPALAGVVTESLAYSTLQAGPEFARWLAERGPARMPDIPDPVLTERDGNTLRISFNRPQRHNAFSTDARAALLEALAVAQLDPSVQEVVLRGNGPSFCSGGDLAEFGTFADPASAHLAAPDTARRWRSMRSPPASGRPAAPRCTARYWVVAWRWRRSADGWCAGPTPFWGCRS